MEKKKYITPECLVVEVEMVSMIAGSVREDLDNSEDGSIDFGGGSDMGSNRHRGEWGNLWSDWGNK